MDFNFILNKKCYRAALSQINLRGEWHSASAYFPWKYPDIITQFSTLCPSGSFGPQLFPSTCVRDEPYTHWFSIIKSVIPTQMLAKPVKQESYSKFFISLLFKLRRYSVFHDLTLWKPRMNMEWKKDTDFVVTYDFS